MANARVTLDAEFSIGEISTRMYGSFLEHLGRIIYEGVYEPDHPAADERGFRTDVLDLVRELQIPVVRYPGGNFVSGYNWEDGVGPREDRPTRTELAWRSIETNAFGTNEFIEWCRRAEAEPMLTVNLGTRGMDAARNLVEYCNFPSGTYWSDMRIAHGFTQPHDVKLWCLGNEMDGWWQMGNKAPDTYGRLAAETGRLMKLIDPSIELVLAGSSYRTMPSFPQWDRLALEEAYDAVDYLSLHTYFRNFDDDLEGFLAKPLLMELFINEAIATCDYVKALKRSRKTMMIAFDEYNVWYHAHEETRRLKPWQVAPPLFEDVYNLEDALVVGCALIVLLRHADRIKVACMSELVNAFAPIMSAKGGPAWRQTIFYPLLHVSSFGRGRSLAAAVESPGYDHEELEFVPYLETIATIDDVSGTLSIFAVNRHRTESLNVEWALRGLGELRSVEHLVMSHDNPKAENTRERSDTVTPRAGKGAEITEGTMRASLPPLSWNVFVLGR